MALLEGALISDVDHTISRDSPPVGFPISRLRRFQ